ncbi:hypothetical protein Tco_1455101 [Tanacetum coccineum]
MTSNGNDSDAKYALSRLLQRGTVAEYQKEFEMLISRVTGKSESFLASIYIFGLKPTLQRALLWSNPTTLGEAFSLASIVEARFEDERSITDIAKTNDLNAGVQVQDLEETIRHKLNKIEAFQTSMIATFEEHEQQENQDNLNEFSEEKNDAKPPIFIDTVGNNGGNDSRTSGSETPAKEVVDIGIESEVVVSLPKEFQEGDMVDALSIVEQKSLGNWKELDNEVFVGPRMSLAATYQKEVVTEWPEEFQEGQPLEKSMAICDSRVVFLKTAMQRRL